jgi:hypothetical protein
LKSPPGPRIWTKSAKGTLAGTLSPLTASRTASQVVFGLTSAESNFANIAA